MATPLSHTIDAPEREEFVVEMIPYVKYLAHRISVGLPPSVDIEDLVHYGLLGLLDACEKFDEDKGVKFKTYAETRIRGAILDGMRSADAGFGISLEFDALFLVELFAGVLLYVRQAEVIRTVRQ